MRYFTLIIATALLGEIGHRSTIADEPIVEAAITDVDREHWAFRPLATPPVPTVRQHEWVQTPVDAFILAKLETLGLTGGHRADRAALLRRLSFDLTGLPPSLEEQIAFENDDRPNAYACLVERFLASPSYGERWAQHWLDLARFADTDGFEHDKIRTDAWKYRDWVIAAFNRDLRYDDFIRQQLAGDELPDGDAVATTFCLAGPDMPDVNDQTERRHFRLNELTSTVGSVILGLQLGCAECHDHKYDPISQADFYRLRAVFESAVPVLKRDQPYYRLANQPEVEPARLWIRGDFRRPGAIIAPGFPRIAVEQELLSDRLTADPSIGLRTRLADILVMDAKALTARVIVNRLWQHHFVRGLSATSSDFGVINADPTHPDLLDWLASDLIQHDWSLKHLHRRIVLSATYQQASRRSSKDDTEWGQRLERDPDNRSLSRSPRRRLDGESLRDALLNAAGVLNHDSGGPGVLPPLPAELVGTLLKGQWTTSPNAGAHTRRSVYLFARRNLRYPLLEVFDRPDANASCAVRGRSTTAPQALVLLNSDLAVEAAQRLASRVLQGDHTFDDRVHLAFRLAVGRAAIDYDIATFHDFIEAQTVALRSGSTASSGLSPLPMESTIDAAEGAAWVDACLGLLNSNEFLYCD